MKKTTTIIAILLASFTFYQCAGPVAVISSPADKELTAAQKRWPDATKESLTQGGLLQS